MRTFIFYEFSERINHLEDLFTIKIDTRMIKNFSNFEKQKSE